MYCPDTGGCYYVDPKAFRPSVSSESGRAKTAKPATCSMPTAIERCRPRGESIRSGARGSTERGARPRCRHLVFLGIASRGMKADVLKGHLDLLLLSIIEDGPVTDTPSSRSSAAAPTVRSTCQKARSIPHSTDSSAGLLESRWTEVNGRRRRSYTLTSGGERRGEKRREWTTFVATVQRVGGGPAWPTMA